MNTEIQNFENSEFGQIRVMRCENNEPWFVGKDVATVLGYKDTRSAVKDHVDEEDKTTEAFCLPGSNYKTQAVIINESGLYSLIISNMLETTNNTPASEVQTRWQDFFCLKTPL